MKVLLLHDAIGAEAAPDDLDVLAQVEAVAEALAGLGHESVRLACTLDLAALADEIGRLRPDMAFNLVESLGGQGRLVHLVPAVLDGLGLPYTGAPSESIFTTSFKPLAKQVMAAAGMPTPEWITLRRHSGRRLPERMIIKSAWEHASRGLEEDCIIATASRQHVLDEITCRAPEMGGEAFAEAYIAGREFNIAMLDSATGPRVLPPAEMLFADGGVQKPVILGYRAKWAPDSPECRNTNRSFAFAPEDEQLLAQMAELAIGCWELFELRGYARVDFRVDEQGRPWILEANANPCLSPDAGFGAALVRAGLSFAQAIERIVAASLPQRLEGWR